MKTVSTYGPRRESTCFSFEQPDQRICYLSHIKFKNTLYARVKWVIRELDLMCVEKTNQRILTYCHRTPLSQSKVGYTI